MGYEDEFDTDVKKGDDLKTPRVDRQFLDERLLVIFPIETKTFASKHSKSGKFKACIADVIVMDGALNKAFRDAGATEFPFTLRRYMFSDWQIVTNLETKIGSAVLVRVESRPSSSGNGRSYGIEKIDFAQEPEALIKAAVEAKRAHTISSKFDDRLDSADEARSEFDQDDEIPF